MLEYAVVGSGIGGCSIAAYLDAKGYKTALFEKDSNLGGCSSTFTRNSYMYNTGATTLAGYQEGHIVKSLFDAIGYKPKLLTTDPAIVILQNGKETPRFRDLEKFLAVVEQNYPHPKNREFWTLVYELNKKFYSTDGYYYSNRSLFKKAVSLLSYTPIFMKFFRYFFSNAKTFLDHFFDGIDKEYLDFLEAQIMIVAQAKSSEINFFTCALALGYTFNETHYVYGGMGALFDGMSANMQDVRKNSEIKKIEKKEGYYKLYTKDEVIEAKNVILNSTVYESAKLFDESLMQKYYQKYEKLDNHQSSFMLYLTIKSDADFAHHYQIIQDEKFEGSISNALFVSFSDKDDEQIAPKGYYSITASIHTDVRFWEKDADYKAKKERLKNLLLESLMKNLDIQTSQIIDCISATPSTFARYINRSQLGGNAITMKNFLPFLPSNDTPIEGLYNVGDTVYAAQGWPGVMLGVNNLKRLLDV